jgi:diadenylate cyclase
VGYHLLTMSGFDRLSILQTFETALRAAGWRAAFEMLLIGAVVFMVLRFLEGTRGARLLKSMLVLLVGIYVVVRLLDDGLQAAAITFLYEKFLLIVSFAAVVVFQPELRRALMRVGETRLFRSGRRQIDHDIDQLVEAAVWCSKRRIGLLIAIEREVGLGGSLDNATRLNADLSASLLNTIFYPKSPLHDLGVIIGGGRVMYAGVQFPLAESGEIEKDLGSRHRAALGMSQESDAVVLVVSEETGDISIAEKGVLTRKLTPEAVREALGALLSTGGYIPSQAGDSAVAAGSA